MTGTLSNSQRHRTAAAKLRQAVQQLKAALRAEDGLEWSGRIRELLDDAQQVAERLDAYAKGG